MARKRRKLAETFRDNLPVHATDRPTDHRLTGKVAETRDADRSTMLPSLLSSRLVASRLLVSSLVSSHFQVCWIWLNRLNRAHQRFHRNVSRTRDFVLASLSKLKSSRYRVQKSFHFPPAPIPPTPLSNLVSPESRPPRPGFGST